MIDPNDFIKSEVKQEFPEDAISVSGTFMCQECDERCFKAKLDESSRKLIYYCDKGHRSEARI
jgi:formylmethanofuran dehydrogenase subunit E